MKLSFKLFSLLMVVTVLISACGSAAKNGTTLNPEGKTVEYSLKTGMMDGQMAFIGVGGGIDGVTDPTLSANVGDTLKINLASGDGVEHNIAFPDFNVASDHVVGQGSNTTLTFLVDKGGSFAYNCVIAGHREAGMEGKLDVTGQSLPVAASNNQAASSPTNASVSAAPASPTTGEDISWLGNWRMVQPSPIGRSMAKFLVHSSVCAWVIPLKFI